MTTHRHVFLWTDEAIQIALTGWSDGLSATQIAARLGGGLSRSSVLGKLYRLGVVGKSTGERRANSIVRRRPKTARVYQAPAKVAKQARKAEPEVAPVELEPLNVSFLKLQPFQCRAVTDDTRFEQRFCGHVRKDGSPWCAAHAVRFVAIEQPKPKARAA